MKQLSGNPHNINNDILGRVTFKRKNFFSRSNGILVQSNSKSGCFGYRAIITNDHTIEGTIPSMTNVDISQLSEGDVILINKKGEIVVLYEKNSLQNVIMATELCNHRCIMCPQPPVAKEQDKTQLNLKLISLFDKDTTEVGISGGEPTMIGDKLFSLIKMIQKHCPKAAITILSMVLGLLSRITP